MFGVDELKMKGKLKKRGLAVNKHSHSFNQNLLEANRCLSKRVKARKIAK